MKTCWRCKLSKPVTEFYKNKVQSSGYQYECKACTKELNESKNHSRKKGNKFCTKCQKIKSTIEFSTNKLASDGLYSYCKLCVKKSRRKDQ